jgi:hypothetical protein
MEGTVISLASKELANGFQHSYLVQKIFTFLNILFTLRYNESRTATVMSKRVWIMDYICTLIYVQSNITNVMESFVIWNVTLCSR